MAKKESLRKEVEEIKETEKKILRKLTKEEKEEEAIEEAENKILSGVKRIGKPIPEKIKRFSFLDFGQAVVGAIVFGIPALWTPDFWNFIEGMETAGAAMLPIPTYKIAIFHLFILFCILITLNFAFRRTLKLDLSFVNQLVKRVFYIYVTVILVDIMVLWMFNKITAIMSTITLIRYLLATTAVGMVGAVTFDFIMD